MSPLSQQPYHYCKKTQDHAILGFICNKHQMHFHVQWHDWEIRYGAFCVGKGWLAAEPCQAGRQAAAQWS